MTRVTGMALLVLHTGELKYKNWSARSVPGVLEWNLGQDWRNVRTGVLERRLGVDWWKTKTLFSENYVPATHQLVQKIRVQTRLIFKAFIVWRPWKLGQGHQNLISSFNHHNDTLYIKFGQDPSFGSRDRVQTSFFLVNIWHSKCWCDLENEVKVMKI